MLKNVCRQKNASLHNTEEEIKKMIKENIAWKANLPIQVLIADIKEGPIHFHNDIEGCLLYTSQMSAPRASAAALI